MEADPEVLTQTLVTFVSTWGLRVVGALALLVIGRIVAGAVRRSTRRALERGKADPSLVPFLGSLA
jgi:small conductance mechanosensitive channel